MLTVSVHAQVAECYSQDFLRSWTKINEFRKPLIGAVNGYCVGLPCLVECVRVEFPRLTGTWYFLARRRMRARDDVRVP